MNDLLNLAIKAHGGLERWRQVRSLQARVTLNGTLWRIKGRPNGLPGVLLRADTRQPALTITPFPSPGSVGHYAPDRVWIAGENNKLVSELNKPRDSFTGAVLTTKWNELQELYFAGYAFWNYFTTPFLLAQPGVEVEEIEPHKEDGETWRPLSVIFPPTPLTRHFISMTRAFFRGMTTPRTWQAAWPLTIVLTMSHSTTSLSQLSAAWSSAEPTAPL